MKARATKISRLIIPVVLMAATSAPTQELSFLQNNSELKARLVRWEHEAPLDVKDDIQVFRSRREHEAAAAARRLGEKGEMARGAILALIQVFPESCFPCRRSPPDYAYEALAALAAIGQSAIEPLIAALQDSSHNVRIGAVLTLRKIGGTRVVEPLIVALNDSDSTVRYEATYALGEIKDVRAVEPLVADLKGNNAFYAAVALGKIKDERAIGPLITALGYYTDSGYYVTNSLGAKGASIQLHQAAQTALGEINPNWRQTEAARSALPRYVAALKGSNKRVAEAAARALGAFADDSTIEPLISSLRYGDDGVREAAAQSLVQFKDTRTVEPFLKALCDNNRGVRLAAAQVLGERKESRAVELLIPWLTNSVWDVRAAAAETLEKIVPNWYQGELGKKTAPMFIAAVKQGDREVCLDAVGFLEKMHVFEPLVDALNHGDFVVRWKAAWALGEIGDRRAIEPLIVAMRDHEDSTMRRVAEVALEKITGQTLGQNADRWESWRQEQKK